MKTAHNCADRATAIRRRHRNHRGFTLIECTMSLMVLLMMIMIFAAVFPLAIRSAAFSNNYAQASFLAQHKIDQLRSAGWSRVVDSTKLNSSGGNVDVANVTQLAAAGINIIDTGQSAGSTYTFTTVDSLTGFFPQGSSGTIAVTPDSNVTTCTSGGPNCSVVNIAVTISWTGGGISDGSYTAYAKLIKMTHR